MPDKKAKNKFYRKSNYNVIKKTINIIFIKSSNIKNE